MDQALAQLIAAAIVFVGTHFALSHPLRRAVLKAVGPAGFQVVYSLTALASSIWMVLAFRAVEPALPLWNGSSDAAWIGATLVMLPAAVLLLGSFAGNPALPDPRAKEIAARGVHGVFHVTRHPMMWAFALWSLAHVLVSPTPRVIVLAGAVAFLALVGAALQDRKKEVLMGGSWSRWERQTSYWPRLGGLAKAGAVPWLGGIALWLIATWAHGPLAGAPAGIWRWI